MISVTASPPVRICLVFGASVVPDASEGLGGGAGRLAVAAEHEVTVMTIVKKFVKR